MIKTTHRIEITTRKAPGAPQGQPLSEDSTMAFLEALIESFRITVTGLAKRGLLPTKIELKGAYEVESNPLPPPELQGEA